MLHACPTHPTLGNFWKLDALILIVSEAVLEQKQSSSIATCMARRVLHPILGSPNKYLIC